MPLQNPQDVAAHSALDTGVHGVGAGTVCSETEADVKIAAHVTTYHPPHATLLDFQANPATGTMISPENVNDTSTALGAQGDGIGEYAEVDFEKWVEINQWRLYGHVNNVEDGEWKIEYYGTDLAWHDWKTGIPTNKNVWTDMAAETGVVCEKVRLTVTAVDSSAQSKCGELEVYHN
ncbi:unnamed protein product [marine sediment metagenome]|uniref:F5/8 type C domain-containing protein n=1 Tax=marine sediment metagenome TaxID=412755 RepID=X1P2F9_9ZZZZ